MEPVVRLTPRGEAAGRMMDDLDLVRSLVHSWGNLEEGSAEQALAITNSWRVLARLLSSAHDTLGHGCDNCGDELPVPGQRFCESCLEVAAWCAADDCPVEVCGGPHARHHHPVGMVTGRVGEPCMVCKKAFE